MTTYSKILVVNANGDYQEISSSDSLQLASFKTATYELTDTLLGKLANPLTTSAGASDSGKYIVLNASGKVDPTMIDNSVFEWQDSVLNIQTDATLNPGASPATGARYIITDKDNLHANFGTIAGLANQDIVQYNGSAWVVAYVPTTGAGTTSDADSTHLYIFNGTVWSAKGFSAYTASSGVKLSGADFQADLLANGGLDLSTNSLYVKTDDSSIEKSGTGALQVKASGIKDSMIDFGTSSGQVSAADIPIADVGNYTTATEVESALQEIYNRVINGEQALCENAVAKGDLLYYSADGQVSKMPITSAHEAIGVAVAAASSAALVGVRSRGTVITGVLSGATRDTKVYWTGTALSTTMPATAGSHVWKVGVATGGHSGADMWVDVEFIKKNA